MLSSTVTPSLVTNDLPNERRWRLTAMRASFWTEMRNAAHSDGQNVRAGGNATASESQSIRSSIVQPPATKQAGVALASRRRAIASVFGYSAAAPDGAATAAAHFGHV